MADQIHEGVISTADGVAKAKAVIAKYTTADVGTLDSRITKAIATAKEKADKRAAEKAENAAAAAAAAN